MSRIKETITALTAGNEPGAVRIKRKEQERLPEWYFSMAIRCIERVALIAAVAAVVIFAEILKIAALVGFGIVFSMFYFGTRD